MLSILSLIRLTEKGPALKEREMEEIWEEGAELELVRRTSPSISDAAWGPEGRARAFVGALERTWPPGSGWFGRRVSWGAIQ